MPSLPKHLLPFPSLFTIPLPQSNVDIAATGASIDTALSALDIRWQYRAQRAEGVGFAAGNVWGRAARRKREGKVKSTANGEPEGEEMDEDEESEGEEEEPALGIRIRVRGKEPKADGEDGETADGDGGSLEVDVRWLIGHDHVLFESFCGWLKRVVTQQ